MVRMDDVCNSISSKLFLSLLYNLMSLNCILMVNERVIQDDIGSMVENATIRSISAYTVTSRRLEKCQNGIKVVLL